MTDTPDPVLFQVTGRVLVAQLNRPKQRNALNRALAMQLIPRLEAAVGSDQIGCIVVTGGPQVFCAGADIAEMAPMSAQDMIAQDFFAEWERFARLPIPKIAAVNGVALGGGCELVLMCDMR